MNNPPVVRTFAPEQWGQLDIFGRFNVGTHQFKGHTKKALAGVGNHFRKALLLRDLAIKLAPNLDIDRAQLEAHGFTPALNAKEFSAVLEAILLELYSSVDCARAVVTAIYQHCNKIPDSTRKLFFRIKNDELGNDFPAPLKTAFKSADWYEELLVIRDELTHADVGACHLDQETKVISYWHRGISRQGSPLQIPNVMERVEDFSAGVNNFLGKVFEFLNSQLRPYVADELCGIFFGRGYMRKLPLAKEIDFNAGTCQSRGWFDKEPGFMCPFAQNCGAYERARVS